MSIRGELGEIKGSPTYSFENEGIIAAGGKDTFDMESEGSNIAKWLPFDSVEINNTSTVNIDVYVNGSPKRRFFVAGGSSKKISDVGIYTIVVTNRSAVTDIAANGLILTFMKERMGADKGVYSIARRLFK